jgi:hypothetical protein
MIRDLFALRIWSVHNPLKMWTLNKLSRREVKILSGTLSQAEINVCLIWTDGWPDWKKLKDSKEFCKGELEKAPANLPPVSPKLVAASEEDITQVHAESINKWVEKESQKNRRHPRFEIKIPVEIVRGDQVFKTTTADVSESGVRFAQDLPEWVAGYFTLIFSVDKQSIEITGALVEDQKNVKDKCEIVDTNDEESGLPKYIKWVRSLQKDHQQVRE